VAQKRREGEKEPDGPVRLRGQKKNRRLAQWLRRRSRKKRPQARGAEFPDVKAWEKKP